MLDPKIKDRLESIGNLPSVPIVVSEALNSIDNPKTSAASLASIIEKDQALTAKVLAVANSPFYGLARKISTIDLAIVILGLNSIRDIVLSLIIKKFLKKANPLIFDVNSFWKYSLFCGSTSRYFARKLGYRIAGEAFATGLMHDIGILILAHFLKREFLAIKRYQEKHRVSLYDAEKHVINCTHCDIGAWLAEKWNLPNQLINALNNHHTNPSLFKELKREFYTINDLEDNLEEASFDLNQVEQPLTLIVALSEYFAEQMGFKKWAQEAINPPYYYVQELLQDLKNNDLLDPTSVIDLLKEEVLEEFEKAAIFNSLAA